MSHETASEPSTRSNWLTLLLLCSLVVILGLVAATYYGQFDRLSIQGLEAYVRSYGPWAVLVYVLLYVAGSPVPFLAPLFSAVGGLLFGPIAGMALVLAAATSSSLIPFGLSRRLGREWVSARLRGKRLDALYQQSQGEKGFAFVLLMRLVPVLPWEVQNYIAGLTRISVPTYLLATALGIIPGTASLVLLGSAVRDPRSWQFLAAIGLNAGVLLIPTVVALVHKRRQRADS